MNTKHNKLVKHFLRGLSIVVPSWATLYISWRVFNLVNGYICRIIQYIPLARWTVQVPGLSILVTGIAIAFIGYLGSTLLFAPIVYSLEHLIMKIPVLNILYSYTKESTFGFLDKLNKPVMVRVGHQGYETYKVGFLTQDDLYTLSLKKGEVAVYLPHSYAFSGEMTIFPKEQVTPLDVSTTEAMRLVLTGGLAAVKRRLLPSQEKSEDADPHKVV